MKKRISICIAAAFSLVALASCSYEDSITEVPTGGFPMTITATVATDPATRVAFEPGPEDKGLKVSWVSTDILTVYLGSVTSSERTVFSYVSCENGQATFSGTLPRTPTVGEKIYAYVNHSYASGSAAIGFFENDNYRWIPFFDQQGECTDLRRNTQLYAEATYTDPLMTLSFHHLSAVFKLTFTFPEEVPAGSSVTQLGLSAASGLYSQALFDANNGYALCFDRYGTIRSNILLTEKSRTLDANRQVTTYIATAPGIVTDIHATAMVGTDYYKSESQLAGSLTLERGKVYAKSGIMMVKSDLIASSFDGGTGTESDPYLIADITQLRRCAQQVNSGNLTNCHFKLTDDIDLGYGDVGWTPIGTDIHRFSGSFDGNNFTISGNMNIVTCSDGGLIGFMKNAVIKNVHMNCTVDGANVSSNCGAIVGNVQIEPSAVSTIENCSNSGSVTSVACVGGIVGYLYSNNAQLAQIIGCTNTGEVTCGNGTDLTISYGGGIIGCAKSYHPDNTPNPTLLCGCVNRGNVIYTGSLLQYRTGGITGAALHCNVLSCWSTATKISFNNNNSYKYSGTLVGQAICTVKSCYYKAITGLDIFFNWSHSEAESCGVITDAAPSADQITAMNNAWAEAYPLRVYQFNASTGEVEKK